MNMGTVAGMAAPVTVAEGPAACKLFEVRTASGSVLVTEAVVVVAAGPMRKVVAVMNWYCWSRLIDGLVDVESTSVLRLMLPPGAETLGKISVRLKMTEPELVELLPPPPGTEMDPDSEVGSGGAGVETETLVGGSTIGVLIEVSGGWVIGVSEVEFPGSKIGGRLMEMEMIGGSVGVALVELSEVETTGGSVGAGVSLVELVEVGSSVGKGIEMGIEIDRLIRGSELVDGEGSAMVGSAVLLVLVLVDVSAVEVETLSLVLVLVDVLLVLSLVLAGVVGSGLELLELVEVAGSVAGSVGAGLAGSVGADCEEVESTGTVMTEGGPE